MEKSTKSVFAQNLQHHLDKSGMRKKDLADALGVYPSTITFWLQGKSAPRADMLDKICKVFHISRVELVSDKVDTNDATSKTLPLYNSIFSEQFFNESNIARHIAVDESVEADFGIIVSSESMTEVGISPGDIGFFSKDYQFKEGNIYAIWLIDADSVMLKKVYIQDNKWVFASANQNMAPLVMELGNALIIGELVGLYKKWNNEIQI